MAVLRTILNYRNSYSVTEHTNTSPIATYVDVNLLVIELTLLTFILMILSHTVVLQKWSTYFLNVTQEYT